MSTLVPVPYGAVHRFTHHTIRPFRWEYYKKKDNQAKMWSASCQFDVKVELNPSLQAVQCADIEYRQFIRGGVWVRRGSQEWAPDWAPNGNKSYPIPPYRPKQVAGDMPRGPVDGVGLSLSWKEDCQIENNKEEYFGYRETAVANAANEKDLWGPGDRFTGKSYHLRDTPSISGEWDKGEPVEVWIELHFKGFVVEVDYDSPKTVPIRILSRRSWSYFWHPPIRSDWEMGEGI